MSALPETDLTRPSVGVGSSTHELGSATGRRPHPLDGAGARRWARPIWSARCAAASELATDYAKERRQYGAPIGSFQAVQHLLADAHVLVEGASSVTTHAAWAIDALPPRRGPRRGRRGQGLLRPLRPHGV